MTEKEEPNYDYSSEVQEKVLEKLALSEILYGIIFTPAKTFSLLREYKPWGWALAFLLAVNIISMLLNVLGVEWEKLLTDLPSEITSFLTPVQSSIGIFAGFFLFPFQVLLFMGHAAFLHLLVHMLGGRGEVLALFSALAFIQVLSLINALINFFTGYLGNYGSAIAVPLSFVFGIWQLILSVTAIKEIYLVSGAKATVVFLLPFILIFSTIVLLVIAAITFFGSMLTGLGHMTL